MLSSFAFAQQFELPLTPVAPAPAVPSLRDAALETLLAERRSPQALSEAAENARKHGVSPQAILEARFLFFIDRRDDAAISSMQPEILAARDGFRLEDSAICSVREDWLAIVEYVQAISALRAGDAKAFKSHISEAFWLSPAQAAAYAPHIEQFQTREAMKSLKVDLQQSFQPLDGQPSQPLAVLADGKKALLLHFWSPWSTECEQSLPDFMATASTLHDHGIAALSLVSDVPAHLPTEARDTIQSHKPAAKSGRWGADLSSRSLARTLRVRNLPCVALVMPDGSVKFHGQPGDEEFWSVLQSIDPAISRPAAKKTEPTPEP
jgi:thiol-disulfide isomerase/thioredoxin